MADELRGNPFIGEEKKYTNPEDEAYGEEVKRTCDYCFFRNFSENYSGDCSVANKTPKKDFKIPLDQVMPKQIDGKEVGHYCRHFADYRCD